MPDQLDSAVRSNMAFRRVLFTGAHMQQVAMSIAPGESVGWEVHKHTSQYFAVVSGRGIYMRGRGGGGGGATERTAVSEHTAGKWVVEPGTWHNVRADDDSNLPLKLLTIYTPPHHPPGTVDLTKRDAELRAATAAVDDDDTEPRSNVSV